VPPCSLDIANAYNVRWKSLQFKVP
jgi:hypothetical protein